MADDGLITVASGAPVGATIDRLVEAVTAAGMRVFARIDHAGGASEVGMELRPTELVLFGHPRGGTPLMQDQQTAGIDLPLKALAWEDSGGRVWLTTDDPRFIARRHGLGDRSRDAVTALAAALERVTGVAVSRI
jgi:uncharacterized protein (DUF302 family)